MEDIKGFFDKMSKTDGYPDEVAHVSNEIGSEEFLKQKALHDIIIRAGKLNDALSDCIQLLEECDRDINWLSGISKGKLKYYKTLLIES